MNIFKSNETFFFARMLLSQTRTKTRTMRKLGNNFHVQTPINFNYHCFFIQEAWGLLPNISSTNQNFASILLILTDLCNRNGSLICFTYRQYPSSSFFVTIIWMGAANQLVSSSSQEQKLSGIWVHPSATS